MFISNSWNYVIKFFFVKFITGSFILFICVWKKNEIYPYATDITRSINLTDLSRCFNSFPSLGQELYNDIIYFKQMNAVRTTHCLVYIKIKNNIIFFILTFNELKFCNWRNVTFNLNFSIRICLIKINL